MEGESEFIRRGEFVELEPTVDHSKIQFIIKDHSKNEKYTGIVSMITITEANFLLRSNSITCFLNLSFRLLNFISFHNRIFRAINNVWYLPWKCTTLASYHAFRCI